MSIAEESLQKHREWQGKIEVKSRVSIQTREDLSLAYTPGVASACLAIQKDPSLSYELTRRSKLVAVITDGTAVLGLGDIGPEAGMPVMEGKCALFKEFADVDAFPVCVRSKDPDEIVRIVSAISGSFGGINLEDISAPRCFEIEKRLTEVCDIPVFHDDQHGTAVVVAAALLNALRLVGKQIEKIRIVINGAGSAGDAIARHLIHMGAGEIICVDRFGILARDDNTLSSAHASLSDLTNPSCIHGSLRDAMRGADVMIGVSAPGVVDDEMIQSMAHDAIVFPMANPTPEIMPDAALRAGARIVGTGRSDFPNQINNVLAFPGIFRGALECRARVVNQQMKMAASMALANMLEPQDLRDDHIIVSPLDRSVAPIVASAVATAARESGVARI